MPFANPLAEFIWNTRYRLRSRDGPSDTDLPDTWRRVARTLAAVERAPNNAYWNARFYNILRDFRFLPGGRILAGAGSARRVTLCNCFVMGTVEDSLDGIFRNLRESALTLQMGGGIGVDFSTLRPRGTPAHDSGNVASGPVSFMHLWDQMCTTLLETGLRRGAMMATLRCDHPDIEAFIAAKHGGNALTHFNLSVLVSDAFLQAVVTDADWPLVFPTGVTDGASVMRPWPGYAHPVACRIVRRVRARQLWEQIMHAAYTSAEPGVLFVDRINGRNNLWYRETISATNPCGELPLPAYGVCVLGSLNLPRFVQHAFTPTARLDLSALAETAATAVRLLDNVIDVSAYPLPEQRAQALASRRIGLGVTGLADALMLLGIPYDSAAAVEWVDQIMATTCCTAYRTSIALAQEKGAFPAYDGARYSQSAFIRGLPAGLQADIAAHGIRNSHLIAIAPTGTISLLAGAVSSGIEPVFQDRYRRKVHGPDGTDREFAVESYALREWRARFATPPPPAVFVDAWRVAPAAHLRIQAAAQRWADHAVSKTINVPADLPFADLAEVYLQAYRLNLKGCTVFRRNPSGDAVFTTDTAADCRCRLE